MLRRVSGVSTLPYQLPSLQAAVVPFPGLPGNLVGFAAAPLFNTSDNPTPGFLNNGTTAGLAIALGTGSVGTLGLTNGSTYKYLDIRPVASGNSCSITDNGVPANQSGGGGPVHDITFIGCRFTAHPTGATVSPDCCVDCLSAGSYNIIFKYCTFAPLVATYANPIPAPAWPSTSVGTGIAFPTSGGLPGTGNTYLIDYGVTFRDAFDPGVPAGKFITLDHCDLWGWGDGIGLTSQAYISLNTFPDNGQLNIVDCWIHDARSDNHNADHTNGILPTQNFKGYSNLLFKHNTVSGLGNTYGVGMQHLTTAPGQWDTITNYTPASFGIGNQVGASDGFCYYCIANSGPSTTIVNPTGNANPTFWTQGGVSSYRNIQIINNHISGFNNLIDCGIGNDGSQNFVVTDNVFSNYVMYTSAPCLTSTSFNGPNGATYAAMFTGSSVGNLWLRNKYQMHPASGVTGYDLAHAGMDGWFVWPDNTLNPTTDWHN